VVSVYGGSAAHHRALTEPKYAKWLSGTVYLPDLANWSVTGVGLPDHDVLLVPERLHRGKLHAARPRLLESLEAGHTVVVFGDQSVYAEHPQGWLPGIDWTHTPTNYWWWLDREATSGLHAHLPEHDLWRHLSLADATWHHHGVLRPPEGAEVLITHDDGGAVLYVDRVSTPGTLVVAALDPMSHFGSYFMPATERFLDGFLPWLAEGSLTIDDLEKETSGQRP
jgi:hypothetical protein